MNRYTYFTCDSCLAHSEHMKDVKHEQNCHYQLELMLGIPLSEDNYYTEICTDENNYHLVFDSPVVFYSVLKYNMRDNKSNKIFLEKFGIHIFPCELIPENDLNFYIVSKRL